MRSGNPDLFRPGAVGRVPRVLGLQTRTEGGGQTAPRRCWPLTGASTIGRSLVLMADSDADGGAAQVIRPRGRDRTHRGSGRPHRLNARLSDGELAEVEAA